MGAPAAPQGVARVRPSAARWTGSGDEVESRGEVRRGAGRGGPAAAVTPPRARATWALELAEDPWRRTRASARAALAPGAPPGARPLDRIPVLQAGKLGLGDEAAPGLVEPRDGSALAQDAEGRRPELAACLVSSGTRNRLDSGWADRLASGPVAWFLFRAREGWEVPGALGRCHPPPLLQVPRARPGRGRRTGLRSESPQCPQQTNLRGQAPERNPETRGKRSSEVTRENRAAFFFSFLFF